jgi:hypothetical protein
MTNSKLPLAFAVVLLAGCASTETDHTKSLLSGAGFRARTPQTSEQQQLYASLPNNKIERATVKGKVFYVFKDEKAGVAYMGGEREHRRYKELCMQQHVEQEPEEQMNRAEASKYYKYWGVGATLF